MNEELLSLGIPSSSIFERYVGGNSEVIKFKNNKGELRALKIYKGDKKRVSKMFEKETKSLIFLSDNGFKNVPRQVVSYPNIKAIEYDWIEGQLAEPTDACLEAIAEMLNKLIKLSSRNYIFDRAVDSISAPSELLPQIQGRLNRLEDYNSQYVKKVREKTEVYRTTKNIGFPLGQRILSMSDLGSHNMIAQEGNFFFIDFEFFGYDSFAKLWGDFLLHPRNHFSTGQLSLIQPSIDVNWEQVRLELEKCAPALALKWSLITRGRAERYQGSGQSADETTKLYWRSEKYIDFFDFLQEHSDAAPLMTFHEYENAT